MPSDSQSSGHMGLSLFRENPVLLSLIAIVLSSQVIGAVLDFKFQSLLSVDFAGDVDRETAFQGSFWGALNAFVLFLQFVVSPLLLSSIALRWVHFLVPTVNLTAIGLAIIEPNLLTVGLAFFLFKAFDYSIFRAAKEVLYVPLGFEERYRAKQVIDVFGYRAGKGISSSLIVVVQKAGVLVSNYYLFVGFFLAAVWLALIFPLTRHQKVKTEISSVDP